MEKEIVLTGGIIGASVKEFRFRNLDCGGGGTTDWVGREFLLDCFGHNGTLYSSLVWLVIEEFQLPFVPSGKFWRIRAVASLSSLSPS